MQSRCMSVSTQGRPTHANDARQRVVFHSRLRSQQGGNCLLARVRHYLLFVCACAHHALTRRTFYAGEVNALDTRAGGLSIASMNTYTWQIGTRVACRNFMMYAAVILIFVHLDDACVINYGDVSTDVLTLPSCFESCRHSKPTKLSQVAASFRASTRTNIYVGDMCRFVIFACAFYICRTHAAMRYGQAVTLLGLMRQLFKLCCFGIEG